MGCRGCSKGLSPSHRSCDRNAVTLSDHRTVLAHRSCVGDVLSWHLHLAPGSCAYSRPSSLIPSHSWHQLWEVGLLASCHRAFAHCQSKRQMGQLWQLLILFITAKTWGKNVPSRPWYRPGSLSIQGPWTEHGMCSGWGTQHCPLWHGLVFTSHWCLLCCSFVYINKLHLSHGGFNGGLIARSFCSETWNTWSPYLSNWDLKTIWGLSWGWG